MTAPPPLQVWALECVRHEMIWWEVFTNKITAKRFAEACAVAEETTYPEYPDTREPGQRRFHKDPDRAGGERLMGRYYGYLLYAKTLF